VEKQQETNETRLAAVKTLHCRLAAAKPGQREAIKRDTAKEFGLSSRQLWRLYKRFQSEGESGLERQQAGAKRRAITRWHEAKVLEYVQAAGREVTPTQVRDALALACARAEKSCPSVPTIRRFLADLANQETVEGERDTSASPLAPGDVVGLELGEQLNEVVTQIRQHGLTEVLLERLEGISEALAADPTLPTDRELLETQGGVFLEFVRLTQAPEKAAAAERLLECVREQHDV